MPGLVGTSLDQIPNQVPYLHPDPKLVEKWRNELSGYREFKVAINWQGNPKYAGDFHRSVPLKFFEQLARVPGVRLFSIQKYDGVDQLAQIAGKFEVVDLGSRLDVDTGPFKDTAAVMTCVDLFITSDTAVAHLAGARRSGMDGVVDDSRLAMADCPRGQPVVPEHANLPSEDVHGLGSGL